MNNLKRPLVNWIIGLITGMIGGVLYFEKIQGLPLFLSFILIGSFIYMHYYGLKEVLIVLACFGVGFIGISLHPVLSEKSYFKENQVVQIQGYIKQIQENTYEDTLILNQVYLRGEGEVINLHTQVKVNISKSMNLEEADTVKIIGTVEADSIKMNPSDFDYHRYLQSENIIAVVKAKSCEVIKGQLTIIQRFRHYLTEQINLLFEDADKGIMNALLLGNDEEIHNDVLDLYSKTGIGHVLSVSGFHVGLIIALLLISVSYLHLPYISRYILVLVGLWVYTLLSGASTSTVRASIMASFMIGARCIWEEEDAWINLALAALIILFLKPFQIFQVGFQLSFAAVGSIVLSSQIITRLSETKAKKHIKLLSKLLPWASVTLVTTPIIAYHFFEVPFLSALLNITIIPVFSLIIIMGWILLGLTIAKFPFVMPLVKTIVLLLQGVEEITKRALQMPLGTLCIGRPSLVSLILYYGVLLLLVALLSGYFLKRAIYWVTLGSISCYILLTSLLPRYLEIAYLYVGQGDGIVITTPEEEIIVIDGGNKGKGKVLEKYIKYQGKRHIKAIMISHSDADHIGGVLDLLDTNITVEALFISKTDASSQLDKMISLCEEKNIKVYRMGALDSYTIGEIEMKCLGPMTDYTSEQANNNSLVCLLKYKDFSALFTGDKEKNFELSMYEEIDSVSVLKASHHGSRTGTSNELLLKVKPRYAIISCGVDNRYNHPHTQTLDALETCNVPFFRTDLQGAICITTNGEQMTLYTQREEE